MPSAWVTAPSHCTLHFFQTREARGQEPHCQLDGHLAKQRCSELSLLEALDSGIHNSQPAGGRASKSEAIARGQEGKRGYEGHLPCIEPGGALL